MAEYIPKEALRAFPIRVNHCDKEHANEHFINGIETVMEYAENLPAADVAPVVHGRWVKYYKSGTTVVEGYLLAGIKTLPIMSKWSDARVVKTHTGWTGQKKSMIAKRFLPSQNFFDLIIFAATEKGGTHDKRRSGNLPQGAGQLRRGHANAGSY